MIRLEEGIWRKEEWQSVFQQIKLEQFICLVVISKASKRSCSAVQCRAAALCCAVLWYVLTVDYPVKVHVYIDLYDVVELINRTMNN